MARCKLPDCAIATDGRCLEGRKENCPNLVAEEELAELPTNPPQNQVGETASLLQQPFAGEVLYSGGPLEISEAREFTSRSRAIVVALAGMSDSGKTSLLARLHQQFQSGPIGQYAFAGSRTLLRFEEINWNSTVESGVHQPTMAHSSRQFDNSFLHLSVRNKVTGANQFDVLLNDISGETFPDAITAEAVCRQLLCLKRADHLAVMVDGEALADRARRHDHCAKAKNFVLRVLRTGQIGHETALHLIISKLDVLKEKGVAEENLEAAARLESEFASQFGSAVAKLSSWRLAARPLNGSMPTEDVIADLFASWAGNTYRYRQCHSTNRKDQMHEMRDFSRFGYRNG